MNRRTFIAGATALPAFQVGFSDTASPGASSKVPVIDITDLYHPYEDPGDNLDIVNAFALPEIDLKAVILDVTDAFRKPVADFPTLWHDPNGPREPGIIPMTQLNYIFNRNVHFGVGPFWPLRSEDDSKNDAPEFQQSGIRLFLRTLRESPQRVEVVSFGSARLLAAAYNREPDLLRQKVNAIHISAGTASPGFVKGRSESHNQIPGGEWNVALDPLAFIRLLRSGLPLRLYPCATKDGAFAYGPHNTYWNLPDLHFLRDIDPKIRNYTFYALGRLSQVDFLRALDGEVPEGLTGDKLNQPHHVWETAVWLNVARRSLVERQGKFRIISDDSVQPSDRILSNVLRPCRIEVRPDARFSFELIDAPTNVRIIDRGDPMEYQKAMREAFPELWTKYRTS